jgi:hypothetical protein
MSWALTAQIPKRNDRISAVKNGGTPGYLSFSICKNLKEKQNRECLRNYTTTIHQVWKTGGFESRDLRGAPVPTGTGAGIAYPYSLA